MIDQSELQFARRIGFVLAQAELALGVDSKLPLDLRLNHILQGGMEQPTKISCEAYGLAFKLSGAGNAIG
jgi:hypothetical protein